MKSSRRVVITSGFDKSGFPISLAELLKRNGIEVAGIVVVNPYTIKRVTKMVKKNGLKYIRDSIPRLLGQTKKNQKNRSPLHDFREENNIRTISLKKWAKENSTLYLLTNSINNSETENFIEKIAPDFVIYGGGGIIRQNIIEASKENILNAHLGPLPEIRGMNAIEWSVLLNQKNVITIHYIDQGIDTGQIIEFYPVNIEKGDSINEIREKAVVAAIKGLVHLLSEGYFEKKEKSQQSELHRQCFQLSSTMRELLQKKLNRVG